MHTGPYVGSKRQARLAARQRATSDTFVSDMERLAALVAQIEHPSDLDVLLKDCDPVMRGEVKKLILALKQKQTVEEQRVELAPTHPADATEFIGYHDTRAES